MQTSSINARELGKSGIEALQRGDARAAQAAFKQIVAAGQADASIFLALGYACHGLKERDAALAAVDNALALEPRNLRALLFKADYLNESGDIRAASSYYLAVVKSASPGTDLPPDLRAEVNRAQAMCDRVASQFNTILRDQLIEKGLDQGPSTRRFRQSLDILSGDRRPYFQEPRYYFFPELPHIQFYDRHEFPWLDKVEAATSLIRAELVEIMKEDAAFKPYVQAAPNRPAGKHDGMVNNPDWSAYYLWKDGAIVAENAARCPHTLEALAEVPITRVAGRSPSILFSLLRPGARIPRHNGFVNTRLICHLPLIVPPGCGFRVGNDTREWVEGKAWLFDDTIEHEAWNPSDQTRVILLFEVWRPELTGVERDLVTAMFEAIDKQGGGASSWNI